MNNNAHVEFGGDATGAVEAAHKAAEAVKASVEQMQISMGSLNKHFDLIGIGFAKITAIVAGGSALKEFVSDAINSDKAALGLGKSLGISTTEASYFSSALNEVGVSQDAVALAGKRITMALTQNEGKFRALGVATRESNGEFRSSKDIMLDVNARLRDFKEGTDRNIEAMKIYGRSYQDLMPFVSKFTDLSVEGAKKRKVSEAEASKMQDEAKEKAIALNLVVGQESVDAMKRYEAAKRAMKEVMEGVNRTVGEALLPRLTAMAEWFASVGPAAVSIMRGVMEAYLTVQDSIGEVLKTFMSIAGDVFSAVGRVITSVFGASSQPMTGMQFFANVVAVIRVALIGLRVGFQEALTVIGGALEVVIANLRMFAEVAYAAMHFDWNGVKKAWNDWGDNVGDVVKRTTAHAVEIATKGAADMQAALLTDATQAKKVTATKDPKDASGDRSRGSYKNTGRGALAAAEATYALNITKELLAEEMRQLEAAHAAELLNDAAYPTLPDIAFSVQRSLSFKMGVAECSGCNLRS